MVLLVIAMVVAGAANDIRVGEVPQLLADAVEPVADVLGGEAAEADTRRGRGRKGPGATGSGPRARQWLVTNIVDGDTVDVTRSGTTERVRLVGIDTPERGACGYAEASEALASMALGRKVALVEGAMDNRDRYGRLLRYLDTRRSDAGLALIEQGLAIARYDSRDGYGRHPREDNYVTADQATTNNCETAAAPPVPQPASGSGSSAISMWANCGEARAAGAAPVTSSDPGYGMHLDGDGDGIGCETP